MCLSIANRRGLNRGRAIGRLRSLWRDERNKPLGRDNDRSRRADTVALAAPTTPYSPRRVPRASRD
jgi:hypothetical protein